MKTQSKYTLCNRPLTFGDLDQIQAIKNASRHGNRIEVEFEFEDDNFNRTNSLKDARWMSVTIECRRCRTPVRIAKPYNPAPLHYESLLAKCVDAECPQCGAIYQHDKEQGSDYIKY